MEYRLYSFNNFYLSPIQHGIQTAHAAVELMRIRFPHAAQQMVNTWATKDKTMILLNGGDLKSLKNIDEILQRNGFPSAVFYESDEALGGILTCVVVVVPEIVYEAKLSSKPGDKDKVYTYTSNVEGADVRYKEYTPNHPWYEVIDLIKSHKLA